MKKLTLLLVLSALALAGLGMKMHPTNPLPANGKLISVQSDFPFPPCPHGCPNIR